MAVPIVAQTYQIRKQQKQLASEIMLLKDRCMRVGLVLTSHSLELATKAVGWEIAALLQDEWPELVMENVPDIQEKVYYEIS